MRTIKYLTTLLILCCPITSAFAQDLTVTGLRLGITLQQAKEKLGSSYTFATASPGDPRIEALIALSLDQLSEYVFSFEDNKLWYVQHEQQFKDGTKPNLQSLAEQLQAKYGQPVLREHPWLWMYDPSGGTMSEIPISVQVAHCATIMFGNLISPGNLDQFYMIPTQFSPACPTSVQAELVPDAGNSALVGLFNVFMVDTRGIDALLQQEAQQKAAASQGAADAAKANKPSL